MKKAGGDKGSNGGLRSRMWGPGQESWAAAGSWVLDEEVDPRKQGSLAGEGEKRKAGNAFAVGLYAPRPALWAAPAPEFTSSPSRGGHQFRPPSLSRCLRDGGHLLVRLQHHPGLLRPLVSRNQVSVGAPPSRAVGGTRPCPRS